MTGQNYRTLRDSNPRKVDFDAGYRIVQSGGEIREIHAIGHPVPGASGDHVEFVGKP